MAYTSGNILFHQNPSFLVWTMLICIMMSVATGAATFFLYKSHELVRRFKLPLRKIVWSIVYALFIAFLLAYGNLKFHGFIQPPDVIDTFHILLKNGSIITGIVIVALLLILPGLVLLFLIGSSSDRIFITTGKEIKNPDILNQQSIEEAVFRLRYLDNLLQSTLQILASIVVFAVLTSKFLGESIESTIVIPRFDLYPGQVSYVYGMYFTLFLCIIYLPVYAYLKNNYNSIKELATHEEGGTSSTWYVNLFGENRFEGSALNNLKLALTVIAPLLTSFLSGTTEFLK